MPQSIKGSIANLFTACKTLYASTVDASGAPVLVTYGPPGTYQPENIVAVAMAVRQPIMRPTLGTARSREKDAEIDIAVSVFVPGPQAAQQTADEALIDLTDMLESYFRTAPNETLSGACREAWVSNIVGPTPTEAVDPQSGTVAGRIADATVTVTARIRY